MLESSAPMVRLCTIRRISWDEIMRSLWNKNQQAHTPSFSFSHIRWNIIRAFSSEIQCAQSTRTLCDSHTWLCSAVFLLPATDNHLQFISIRVLFEIHIISAHARSALIRVFPASEMDPCSVKGAAWKGSCVGRSPASSFPWAWAFDEISHKTMYKWGYFSLVGGCSGSSEAASFPWDRAFVKVTYQYYKCEDISHNFSVRYLDQWMSSYLEGSALPSEDAE